MFDRARNFQAANAVFVAGAEEKDPFRRSPKEDPSDNAVADSSEKGDSMREFASRILT